jgi:hypothetical protein
MPEGPDKRRIPFPDGSFKEGTLMSFRATGEHWNEYLVDDGTVIRIKLVSTEIVKVDGEYDHQGNPIYFVQSQNVMAVNAPERLRKGGEDT